MKKQILILNIVLCTALSGCGNGKSDTTENSAKINATSDMIAISTLYSKLNTYQKNITESTYENLLFTENFTLSIPDASAVSRFQMKGYENQAVDDELLEYGSKALTKYFSDLYTEEERADLLEKAELQESELFLETPEIGLTIFRNGYIHAYNRGVAMALDENSSIANIYFPAENHEILQAYSLTQLASSDHYMLTDGDCTVAQAVCQANALLSENTDNPDLCPEVCNAYAVQLTDSVDVFQMSVRLIYGNVPFDVYDSLNSSFYFRALEEQKGNEREYENMPGKIVIAEQDHIDFQISVNTSYTITVQESADNCISPEKALAIASDYFSDQIIFAVDSLELVYAPYMLSEIDASTIQEQVDPVWKVHAYNENDGRYYVLYVDALTGECDNCGYSYSLEEIE